MAKVKEVVPRTDNLKYNEAYKREQFVRLSWNSRELEKKWRDRLSKAQKAYYKLEVETVRQGMRKCGVYIASPRQLPELSYSFSREGLYFLPVFKTPWYPEISARLPEDEPREPWKYHGVVGKSLEVVNTYRRAAANNNHAKIGRLLGYPECCISSFRENNIQELGLVDPFWKIAVETSDELADRIYEDYVRLTGVSPYLNFFFRKIGVALIPHIPCSFDCHKSLEMAREWYELGQELSLEGMDYLYRLVSKPLRWRCEKGKGRVSTPLFDVELSSSPISSARRLDLDTAGS